MGRGRKALPGTHEGREFVVSDKFDKWVDTCPISGDGQARIKKAVMFGLGVVVKSEDTKETCFGCDDRKTLPNQADGLCTGCNDENTKLDDKPIQEKLQNTVEKRKQALAEDEGDEYFAPENCYEAE